MKNNYPLLAFSMLVALARPAWGDLYVTNFTALNGTAGASGVWRNLTTATDLAFPVTLSQTGGTVRPADGSSTQSRIDNTFTWQALPPFAGGANAFSPNFDGDYINIETAEGNITTVTLNFGAAITDPVLSLTDVEYRTTLTFPNTLTVLSSTSNLLATATTISSTGSPAANDTFGVFGEEAACSIRFSGTFQSLVFTVTVLIGDETVGPNDRTGYVVSTATPPVAAAPAVLSISRSGGQVTLSWPLAGFSQIQMSATGALSGWMPIPGLNPALTDSWTEDIADLGSMRFFRGEFP